MGPLRLKNMRPGEWRELTEEEVSRLRAAVGSGGVAGQVSGKELSSGADEGCPVSTIAIDGPVASGKSTLGALLAAKLGYLYFDTGVMYRAVTWVALTRDLSISGEGAITRVAEEVDISVTRPTVDDGRQYTVFADGEDITWEIRRPEVEQAVSPVSAYPGVRNALTRQQRRIGREGRIVMVGRDIGTVVMPDADLKIYLTASEEERARRRCLERQKLGLERGYDEVLRDIRRRDRIDSGRKAAPLKAAQDAVTVDSSSMSIADVLRYVERLVDERCRSIAPRGGEIVER
jgi:cytidylate kinase